MNDFWACRPQCACSELGLIEVIAAISRRQRQHPPRRGSLAQTVHEVRDQFTGIQIIGLTASILARGADVAEQRGLRAADALHLASALFVRDVVDPNVTLIASDAELITAAAAAGLATLDPQTAPPNSHQP